MEQSSAITKLTDLANLSLRLNPNLVFQYIEDEALLLNMQTNQLYELNSTAIRFWELLSIGTNLLHIQEQLLEEFDVNATQLAEEITAILVFMQQENLVQTN